MSKRRLSKSEIFNAVVEVDNELQRAKLLTELCGNDLELRREIEELLAREQQLGSFLDSPPVELQRLQADTSQTTATPGNPTEPSSNAGRVIGHYKLIQAIGAGGMGEVWVAEQSEPVKRRVALKLIKGGSGSKEILARFDVERQALALMNHPNIARILDAGTTDDGQPYFVMELVVGKPLTIYCDENRLSIDERLKLFLEVCSGVQHAHQKGIIHRDLKPGNIIVGMRDGVTVPKIIDFGLAKALESTQRLTDQSLFTGVGQILGTFKYMSPEQASLDNLDIDTRTDIYALGVILYELLTGSTPLDDSSIKGQAALKVLEFIRDKDPVKPSSKLGSSTDEQVSSITGQRRTDSVRLKRILLGDLDWIVMKALEKDRTRRYESAFGFAADIRRYLNSEPVVARPPSLSYRVRKFVRKNRVGMMAASLVALALVGGIVGTSLAMLRAWRAEEVASRQLGEVIAAKAEETKQRQEAEMARARAEANELTARKHSQLALSTLATVVSDIQGGLKNLAGSGEVRRRLLNTSLNKLEGVTAQYLDQSAIDYQTMNALTELGDMVLQFGQAAGAEQPGGQLDEQIEPLRLAEAIHTRAHQIATDLVATAPDDIEFQRSLGVTHHKNGDVQLRLGNNDTALAEFQKALSASQKVAQADPFGLNRNRDIATAFNGLGAAYQAMGLSKEALASFRKAEGHLGQQLAQQPEASELQNDKAKIGLNIANILMDTGNSQDAMNAIRSSIQLFSKLRNRHREDYNFGMAVARSRSDLGDAMSQIGRLTEALAELRNSRSDWEELVADDPTNLEVQSGLANCLQRMADLHQSMGDLDAAELALENSLSIARKLMQSDVTNSHFLRITVNALCGMGDIKLANGKTSEAEAFFEEALDLSSEGASAFRSNAGIERVKSTVIERLAAMYLSAGELVLAAEAYQKMADIKTKLASADPLSLIAQDELASAHLGLGNVRMAQQEIDLAAAEFEVARSILERLRQTDPSYLRADLGVSIAYERLSNVESARGNTPAAIERLEQKLAHDTATVARNPAATEPKRNLATCQANLGYLYLSAGSTQKATAAFQTALQIRQELASQQSSNLYFLADLASGWQVWGDLKMAMGKIPEALSACEQALNISQQLAAQDPENMLAQLANSISTERMGTVSQRMGRIEKALEYFERKLANDLALVAKWPGQLKLRRELSYAYRKVGDLNNALGKLDEAEAHFKEVVRVCEAIALDAPDDPISLRDLSTAFERMGNLALDKSDASTALEYYTDMLEIKRKISERDPANQDARSEYSIAIRHVGEAQQVLGNLEEAIKAYRESLTMDQARAVHDPTNVGAQRGLLASFDRLSLALAAHGDTEEGIVLARKRLDLSTSRAAAMPEDGQSALDLLQGHGVLGTILRDSDQGGEALLEFQKALQIAQRLVSEKKFVGQIDGLLKMLTADIAAIEKSSAKDPDEPR